MSKPLEIPSFAPLLRWAQFEHVIEASALSSKYTSIYHDRHWLRGHLRFQINGRLELERN